MEHSDKQNHTQGESEDEKPTDNNASKANTVFERAEKCLDQDHCASPKPKNQKQKQKGCDLFLIL